MRRVLLTIAVSATCLGPQVSRADFTVKSSTVGQAGATIESLPGVVADQPHIDPGDSRPGGPTLTTTIHPRAVVGFGNQVPLSFACRQIVPRGVRISYGAGASPDALVDWKGGDLWPLVLGRAIRPLGLHMVSAGTRLTIKH